jgi:hypothetical protein
VEVLRVLALDPGERVGWARAVLGEDGTWSEFRHGITPLWDMATATTDALGIAYGQHDVAAASDYDVVVMEEWRLYPHMANNFVGSAFPSVQFIGAVRLCCKLSGTKLVMQGASVKKTADKTLAKLRPDLHELVTRPIKHDDGHDLDAIRHLWVYTYRNTDVTALLKGAA